MEKRYSHLNRSILERARARARREGVWSCIGHAVHLALIRPWRYLRCLWQRVFARDRTFEFNGGTYSYFWHTYNATWENSRCVEIPIVWRIVESHIGREILEVGDVLSHYFDVSHDIVDKYARGDGLIREDVVDFTPAKRYDLIVSISTLEHVGWDEEPQEPMKPLRAIEHLKTLLARGAKLVVTLPVGQNPHLDRALREGTVAFTESYSLLRTARGNTWAEADPGVLRDGSLFIGVTKDE